MHKKIIYILSIIFFVTSCESMGSVKRALTGEKTFSTDEFLIKKKDPLVMPPDYENLPVPDDEDFATEEATSFEKKLETLIEDDSSTSSKSGSVEDSILKKIRSK